jgi:hypothetical protein
METLLIPTIKVDIAPELLTQVEQERQVTIALRFRYYLFRRAFVDPEATLVCNQTGHTSRLVSYHNAELYPGGRIYLEDDLHPVMIFEGLPRECTSFDLREPFRDGVIPWVVFNVPRNDQDVYTLLVA